MSIQFCTFFRLLDGFSALQELSRLADEPPTLLHQYNKCSNSNSSTLATTRIWATCTAPFRLLSKFVAMELTQKHTTSLLALNKVPREPYSGPLALRTHSTITCTQGVSMVKVKSIAKQYGVSVNAVIQTALTATLREFLLEKSILASAMSESIPDFLFFPLAVPVPDHPPGLCNSL